MDVTRYLDLITAPRAVFDRLPELRTRPRFMLPTPDGDWSAVTWEAYAQKIRRATLALEGAGLLPGDRAAIFAPNSVEWISGALAVQAAGGVMVPIYPANTPDQAAYVASHSDAKVLFVGTPALLERVVERWDALESVRTVVTLDDATAQAAPAILEAVKKRTGTAPSFADVDRRLMPWSRLMSIGAGIDQEQRSRFDRLLAGVSLDQVGLMLYTSGTSGNPKGVPLTHKNVGVNGHDWLVANAPLLDDGMVDLLWLPMSHIFGFGEACLGNRLGFTTYLCDPMSVVRRLPEVRPSVFMSVPSVWEKLATAAMAEPTAVRKKEKLAEVTGGQLKFCLSGGAGLKREVKELFHASGILIVEGYGLTETSPTLTLNRPDAFRFDSVGKPLPSVQIMLAEDGEILARGPNVFTGYHKDPAATAECFTADGWFKTGDIGTFTEDGFLRIIDRKKDILVTAGGKHVPPANIEIQFRDDPMIANVVVYGDARKFLVAGVWLHEGVSQADAREHVDKKIAEVNTKLASFETVKRHAIVETPLTVQNGLLTATLKVRRKRVYEAFKDLFEGLYA